MFGYLESKKAAVTATAGAAGKKKKNVERSEIGSNWLQVCALGGTAKAASTSYVSAGDRQQRSQFVFQSTTS